MHGEQGNPRVTPRDRTRTTMARVMTTAGTQLSDEPNLMRAPELSFLQHK